MALLASMAEGMPETIAAEAMERSVVPLCGMADGLAAIAAASQVKVASQVPLLLPNPCDDAVTLTEAEAKSALSQHGLRVPKSVVVGSATDAGGAANDLGFPVVLKGIGFAHKTEAGAVRVGLTSAKAVLAAASAMPCSDFLVEEMITETVAELLVGVLCDPAHGFVLTIGAGGVLTEILSDTVSLLLPVSSAEVEDALCRLRCFPLLQSYRGKAGANVDAIVAAVLSVQEFVQANQDTLKEVEINPLLCGQKEAIAVDALIRMGGNQ